MTQSLPEKANLDLLKKQAKTLLKALKAKDPDAVARFLKAHLRLKRGNAPDVLNTPLALNDAQWVVARENGFKDWTALKHEVLVKEHLTAARNGDTELLKQQLKRWPALITKKMPDGPGAIHLAALSGQVAAVRLLLEYGADSFSGFGHEQRETTPLQLAKDAEHTEVVAVLEGWLAKRATVAKRDNPLIAAVAANDLDSVRDLVAERPWVVNEADELGETALILASRENHMECVKLLLEAGADATYLSPNPTAPIYLFRHGRAAIHRVTHHRSQDQMTSRKILCLHLDHGAPYDHEIAAWMGDTEAVMEKTGRDRERQYVALIAAAQMGELSVVRRLLDHGVDPNTPRDIDLGDEVFHEEGAAVWEAAAQGHLEVVRELLKRGAKPNEVLYASGWPVTIADSYGHAEVVELLTAHGAPPPIGWNSDSLTEIKEKLPLQMEKLHRDWALPIASRTGRTEIVEYLLSLDPQIDDEMWTWCLRYTLYGNSPNSPQVLRMLIDHKANPDARDNRGESLLHVASMRQGRTNPAKLENARVLIENGADLNVLDKIRQSTPLGYATRAGEYELAELFLELGADPNLCGESWAHPLRWAGKKGHMKIAELLTRHGARTG